MNNTREIYDNRNENHLSLWDKANAKLPERDREKLRKILSIKPDASSDRRNDKDLANRLLTSCQNAQKKYTAKKLELPIGDKKIEPHKLWDDTIETLQKVKDLGTALTGLNQTASSVWSIAMVLVEIPVKKAEVANSVAQGLGKAIIIMARGVYYERQAEEMRGNERWERHSQRFDAKLLDLYTETLKFFAAVSRYYRRNSVSRTWHCVWGDDAISNFDKSTAEIELELNKWVQVKFQDKTNLQLQAILQLMEDLKLQKEQQWILENTVYKDWGESNQKTILCINGIPGAGKTKLISRLVDSYNDALENDEPDEVVADEKETSQLAYFYCRQDDSKRQDWRNILCTLAKQLARSCNRLPFEVMNVFRERGRPDSPDPNMTPEECEEILKTFIQSNGKVTLIVDAFDECTDESKRTLREVFDRLAQSPLCVSVIMSSREDDAFTGFRNMTKIRISPSDNGADIIKFVQEKISNFRADEKRRGFDSAMSRLSSDLEDEIIHKFKEKSKGMFQWASIHIQYILSLSDMVAMREALEDLSENLKMAYDKMFRLIDDDKGWKNIALRAFMWLHANGGSCETSVLVAAASHDLDRTMEDVHKTIQDNSMINAKCRNLVDICDSLSRFAHLELMYFCIETILTNTNASWVIREFLQDPYKWLAPKHHFSARPLWEWHCSQNGSNGDDFVATVALKTYRAPFVTIFTALAYSYFYLVQSEGWIDFEDPESVADLWHYIAPSSQTNDYIYEDDRDINLIQPENEAVDPVQPALYMLVFSMTLSCWRFIKELPNFFLGVPQATGPEEAIAPIELTQRELERNPSELKSQEKIQVLDLILTQMISKMGINSGFPILSKIEPSSLHSLIRVGLLSLNSVQVSDESRPMLRDFAALTVWAICLSTYPEPERPIPPKNSSEVLDHIFESFDLKPRVECRCLQLNGYHMPRVFFYNRDQRYLDFMLANGDVNFTPTSNKFGIYGTPLIAAIGKAHFGDNSGSEVEFLLDKGADVNRVAEIGIYRTALTAATAEEAYTTVKLLIDSGAKLNTRVDSWEYHTAINTAIQLGYIRITFLLMARGSDKPSTEDLSQDSLVTKERSRGYWDQKCQTLLLFGAEGEEWDEPCSRAGNQLIAAAIFKWLGVSIPWAEPYLVEACKCLSWYSRHCSTDFRASGKLAEILGYGRYEFIVKQQLRKLIEPMNFRSVNVEQVNLFLDELLVFICEVERCQDMIGLPRQMEKVLPDRFGSVRVDSFSLGLREYGDDDMGACDVGSEWFDDIL
ncbi:hypothetical protein N7488_004688 [Penicillium malachiteum]|nr:hypothetical protein N7488_004688 [Penicillium malachiteum]